MPKFSDRQIRWTNYMLYRIATRGFEKDKIEHIIRFSSERYFDTETRRHVLVGKHGGQEVMIPYDEESQTVIPVTIHVVARQQIRFRRLSGRFKDAQ